jgi:uncharacterized membrane protein
MTFQFHSVLKNKWSLALLILTPLIVLVVGTFVLPDLFYDQFLWKYFWGPIIEDATSGHVSHHGIVPAEKFTVLSELIYGMLVIGALLGLYRLLKRWNVPVDFQFLLSVLPFIIYGSVARVLEDAHFFTEPVVYWFVTPLIYFQIFIIALILLAFGHFLEAKKIHRLVDTKSILFCGGIIFLAPFVVYILMWMSGRQWSATGGIFTDVFLLVIFLVSLTVVPVYLFGRYFRSRPEFVVYSFPLNLAMILGHMLDGISSYISIYDPLNMGLPSYTEKHPASDMLMQIWPPLFPVVKFLLIILVIYVFDVLYKDDLAQYPCLVNLLKIGIFILGFAPGLRDLLRVSMGV